MCGNTRPTNPPVQTVVVQAPTVISPISREVRNILRLQRQADERQRMLSCNRDELGEMGPFYNTRPFILYLPNGEEFSIRIGDFLTGSTTNPVNQTNSILNLTTNLVTNSTNSQQRSSIFRVEEVTGNGATLRALKYILGKTISTCYCCTVNLDEFVGIQTLNDTFIAPMLC
jgi:hypothetical protein